MMNPSQSAQKRTYSQMITQSQGVPMLQQQMAGRPMGLNCKKRYKFSEKIVSPEIRALVPEAEAYTRLLAFEQKLDSTLTRKRLEIQESLKRPNKIKKKLRIFVSHEFTIGKEPERDGDEASVPMWELRVEGRLVEAQNPNPNNPSSNASSTSGCYAGKNPSKRKFSSFFKSLVIELDKDIYGPDNHLVEWHRTPQTNETDGFQVRRPGQSDVKCTILLLLDHQPMKFKLAHGLSKLLGIAMETRPKIIEALWQYVKAHKLQDNIDRDVLNCDQYLEQIFNRKKMRFMEIPQCLQPLLQQPDPVVLNHVIKRPEKPDKVPGKSATVYDIEVEIDDPVKMYSSAFLQNFQNETEIVALDQTIYDIVEQLKELKVRRDFYAKFANNPLDFIQKWLISQSRDLKNMSEASHDFESERRSAYYSQSTIDEGVYRYIYGKVLQKRFELETSLGIRNN